MTCPHSSINRRTPSSCTLWPFPRSSWSCLYKLDAAGINNPSVLLIIIILTISGPAAVVFQGWPMVPHQTHLRIYSVAPSAGEPSQPQSIQSRTLLWLYWRLECNWICCKSTFLNLYRGWGHIGLGQYTHEIFFISSDVRPASTSPAGSSAPGRTGRILLPLMVLCNQEPLAVYYWNHTANYGMLSNI